METQVMKQFRQSESNFRYILSPESIIELPDGTDPVTAQTALVAIVRAVQVNNLQ